MQQGLAAIGALNRFANAIALGEVFDILPEMVYSVTSATTQPTRIFQIGTKTFSYFTIKREAFSGYIPVKRGGRTVLIAEPEKALVDYLYFVSLSKKPKNERLNTANMDKQKVLYYASLYQRTGLDKLVKEVS